MARTNSFRSSPCFIVAVICITVFTDSLAFGVVIPVLPHVLLNDANVPEDKVQSWLSCMLALYGIALLVFSPIFGYVSDHYWKKTTCLMAGLPAMAVGLLVFMAFGTSPLAMSVARTLQGVSSAAVGVGAMALVLETLGAQSAAVGVSFYMVANCLSNAMSPMFGGVLYDNLGYQAVFTIPATLLCLNTLLLLLIKPNCGNDSTTDERIVFVGHGLRRNSWASANPNYLEPTERSPLLQVEIEDKDVHAMCVSVVECENKSSKSMLDLLKNKQILNAICVVTFSQSVFAAFEAVLPFFLLHQFAWSPTKTGLLFLISSLPKLASPLAGKLVDRYGACYPTFLASTICAVSLLCLQLVTGDALKDKILLAVFLAVHNLAAATVDTAMVAEVGIKAGEMQLAALGGALVNVALAGGLMFGPVLGGLVYSRIGWPGLNALAGVAWALFLPGVWLTASRRVRGDNGDTWTEER